MTFRRRWNAAKMRTEIINVLTEEMQRQMERGIDKYKHKLIIIDDKEKDMYCSNKRY